MKFPLFAFSLSVFVGSALQASSLLAQTAVPVSAAVPSVSPTHAEPSVRINASPQTPPAGIAPTPLHVPVTPPGVAPNPSNSATGAANSTSTNPQTVDESKPVVDSTSVGISTGGVGNAVNQAGNRDLISPPYFNHSIKGGGLALPK